VLELNKDVIILGYSGHALVVIESVLLNGYNILGYADVVESKENPYSLIYLGSEMDSDFKYFNSNFVLGIGDNVIRSKVYSYIKSKNGNFINIIHPDSSVSKSVKLGNGVFVAKNVSINPFVNIGDNVIINTSASIDHESVIGSGVHIAPNSTLLGNVKVGENVFIGANSVIKQGVLIGSNAIIGAGSVVLKRIEDNALVYGNPAKVKNR
jgi:sugar O-acyltransferase (sialic acid O-acetyltransferase NeuD family)